MTPSINIWKDKRADAILTETWGKIGTPQIAGILTSVFGSPVSKRAVIGRARRIGLGKLSNQRQPVHCREPVPIVPRRQAQRRPEAFKRLPGPPLAPLPPPLPAATDAPPEKRLTLQQLKRDSCRFVLGDVGEPDWGFCPETQHPGSSYCPDHTRRCNQAPR